MEFNDRGRVRPQRLFSLVQDEKCVFAGGGGDNLKVGGWGRGP